MFTVLIIDIADVIIQAASRSPLRKRPTSTMSMRCPSAPVCQICDQAASGCPNNLDSNVPAKIYIRRYSDHQEHSPAYKRRSNFSTEDMNGFKTAHLTQAGPQPWPNLSTTAHPSRSMSVRHSPRLYTRSLLLPAGAWAAPTMLP